ncbi:hypothetical protein JW935_28760 [candidate division KSB1 bacterium]|nr:hypothetical protein [candidate division KSB1 bacterium]
MNMLFFHFEPRAYHLTQDVIEDSIDHYIKTYGEFLYDPESLKARMQEDFSFAQDQLAQKKIFQILIDFRQDIQNRIEYKDIDLSLKIHFILWDEAFEFLQKEAKDPSFSVSQIASAFLGGVAEHNNILSLEPFNLEPETIFNEKCLKSCRIENQGDLLALPFWASMRSLLIRKDMINASPDFDHESGFTDWDSFENAGKQFNDQLEYLRSNGFPHLQRFWAINISDRDMNTLQTLTPAIYSFGGKIIKNKLWWKEVTIHKAEALAGIKKWFAISKSVGSLEECSFGELLNRFHTGHFAVVMCGTWEHMYWRNTNPDSSSYIEIKLPPSGPDGPATLLWGCNLVIFKQKNKKNYDIEVEFIKYLASNPKVQHEYVPANSRLSVLKEPQDFYSNPMYYEWMNDPHVARTYPNNKEMFKLIDALTQKYLLASILQNVKGAPELSDDVWKVIENGIQTTAFELNRQVIPTIIFYGLYSKINIIFIVVFFSVVGFLFIHIVKRIRHSEDLIIHDLSERLKRISDEKLELEKKEKYAREKLTENQGLVDELYIKLEKVTKEFVKLKSTTKLEKIEKYTAQMKELISRNGELESELEKTLQQIKGNDRVVEQLQKELDDIKNPEIYIDFFSKTIRKKDGSLFILSSAADQYKNDVFRYLEFIVRHQTKRIHLLSFGLIDSRFFQKALNDGKVREYNYKGKFAKVRSGINRTFKNNIGMDLIVQDKEHIYVYYDKTGKIYNINTKDKKIEIVLADIQSKNPLVATYFGYDTFDYYWINEQIKINSNIQESILKYKNALELKSKSEKIKALEEALELDEKNYAAQILLLQMKSLNDSTAIRTIQRDIEEEKHQLYGFLSNDLNYRKNISSIKRIKQEYKDLYSWKYVNAVKSEELVVIGETSFAQIIKYETDKIRALCDQRKSEYDAVQKYWVNLENIKILGQYFQTFIDKTRLKKFIIDFVNCIHRTGLDDTVFHSEIEIKKAFIKYLFEKVDSNFYIDKDDQLLHFTYDLLEWLFRKQRKRDILTAGYLQTFFQYHEIDSKIKDKIEKFCHWLANMKECEKKTTHHQDTRYTTFT